MLSQHYSVRLLKVQQKLQAGIQIQRMLYQRHLKHRASNQRTELEHLCCFGRYFGKVLELGKMVRPIEWKMDKVQQDCSTG